METITIPPNLPIAIDRNRLVAICRRYGIRELALFGSVLRDDFTPDSDVDLSCSLLSTSPARGMDWIRLMLALEDLLGRPVDLVKPDLLDPLIRDAVIKEAKPIYVASPG
jgi:predicted nucleotidyltransferase